MVLLRTGVLMHIKKYMQTLGLLPLDIPEKPQAAEPPEEAQSEGVDLPADTGIFTFIFLHSFLTILGMSLFEFWYVRAFQADAEWQGQGELSSVLRQRRCHSNCRSEYRNSSSAGDEDEEAAEPVQAALQLPQQLDLPEAVKRGLKRQWHALQDTVQQLRPIERFRVVGVAFRRCCSLPAGIHTSAWEVMCT